MSRAQPWPAVLQAGSLAFEEPRLKSHVVWGELDWRERLVYRGVKIQDLDHLKERLRLCWARISQRQLAIRPYSPCESAKRPAEPVATAALNTGSSDDRVIEALGGPGCLFRSSQIKWRLCCDKGMANRSVLVRRNLFRAKTCRLLFCSLWLFETETECEYTHSKGNCPLFLKCRIWQSPTTHRSWIIWLES